MRKSTKSAVVAGTVLALTGGGVAFAYWTTSGAGSGSAVNASSNGNIVLTASWDAGIVPGTSKTVSFAASNAGTSNLYVGTVHLDTVAVDDAHSGCDVADFTMADVDENQMIAAESSDVPLTRTGTLVFANSTASQDDCKGATITLNLTSN